jgi:diadenosine tetraphosphate (Ap4A) HIT family hydrolase
MPKNSREDYKKILKKIEKTGKCPFCDENLEFHKEPIIKKYRDWFITKNSYPYQNTKYHFLIIPKKHLTDISELNSDDLKSIQYLIKFTNKNFKVGGGKLFLKFGEKKFSLSSIDHLHFHLIIPLSNKFIKI